MIDIRSENISIKIQGLVQGIGFRPFVYRAAAKHNISGYVKNCRDGVSIAASGNLNDLRDFVWYIRDRAPEVAKITRFLLTESNTSHKNGFHIILSEDGNKDKEITQIGPDIAVCKSCLKDLKSQVHRLNYPFINCTNCGPRFSIIRDLPYDRDRTTMDEFKMCEVCKKEYEDPGDRRFHAQPVACLECGPNYHFISAGENSENLNEILELTSTFIQTGGIIAIKGIGGFFIACDATNNEAVIRLRKLKSREGKPFAVMFRDIKTVSDYCFMSEMEKKVLNSWRRPIVIVKSKKKLPESISNNINTTGALLPYMPFHYLLFEKLKTDAIVFTSGNFADEPIVIANDKAENDLMQICSAVVSYNRDIYNRTDDSLLQVINDRPRMMRRSRGWAPDPINLKFRTEGILGTGAELKNTFCVGKGKQAILSQHIGDLKDFATYSFFERNIDQFCKMFRINPQLIVCDMHPGYLSTQYARDSGLPVIKIQHHHAHVASCMAEHNLDEQVIGISFDGTGMGDDGNIWGSEFFVCDLQNYNRILHLDYVAMPGGDQAVKEPWRMAFSWLYKTLGNEIENLDLPFMRSISDVKKEWIIKAINGKINCPLTSGSGRLFDAVSSLLGFCNYSTFEAEAPMRLENAIDHSEKRHYPFKISQVIDLSEMFSEILTEMGKKVSPGIISAKLHNTVSEIIINGVEKIKSNTGIKKVVLSGGAFQNRYLMERTEVFLLGKGYRVYTNNEIPCNDGGVSLGQLAIAAKRRKTGFTA